MEKLVVPRYIYDNEVVGTHGNRAQKYYKC